MSTPRDVVDPVGQAVEVYPDGAEDENGEEADREDEEEGDHRV